MSASDAPDDDEGTTKPEGRLWNGREREKIRTLEKEVKALKLEVHGEPGKPSGLKSVMIAVGEKVNAVEKWQIVTLVLGVLNLLVLGGVAINLRNVEDQIYLLKQQQTQQIELILHSHSAPIQTQTDAKGQ